MGHMLAVSQSSNTGYKTFHRTFPSLKTKCRNPFAVITMYTEAIASFCTKQSYWLYHVLPLDNKPVAKISLVKMVNYNDQCLTLNVSIYFGLMMLY